MRRMAGGGKPGVRDQEPEFVSEDASGGTGSKRPDSGTFGTEVNHREELRGFLFKFFPFSLIFYNPNHGRHRLLDLAPDRTEEI